MQNSQALFLVSMLLIACQSEEQKPAKEGLAVLGFADDNDEVSWTLIGDSSDGLDVPRDLGFNPEKEGELWVVNRTDDSVTVFSDAGTDAQMSQHILDSLFPFDVMLFFFVDLFLPATITDILEKGVRWKMCMKYTPVDCT
mgnify:CR=1 FL=1